MSDDGLMQQLWRALQGSTVPTPFGWTPMQDAIPSRDAVADVAGWPIDTASRLWRESDLNSPQVRDRIYSTPPMLGSDFIRGCWAAILARHPAAAGSRRTLLKSTGRHPAGCSVGDLAARTACGGSIRV